MLRCALVIVASLLCLSVVAEEKGQYRSRILLDPLDKLGQGSEVSTEELEKQINSISDPYTKSSAGRHLARHYVQQKDYARAIDYYQQALASDGLSPIANREMLRELAQVYLLQKSYSDAAASLEQVLAIDLVAEAGDYLLLARSHYGLGSFVDVVVALDGIAAAGLTLDAPQAHQALALYYRAGAYEQCEELLQQLLKLEPANNENWHQLATVYLKQNKQEAALDQLMLAREKGIAFTGQQTLLLIDLHTLNGNPYGAALLLEQALELQQLAANAANYRKLFELYLQARERDSSAAALAKAALLSGDTELYLYLAQLQMEQEQWPKMQQTLLEACAEQLPDKFVSRANLLLGISQLKLGNSVGARRYFINATLVGGANMQAMEWLDFMNAEPATEKERKRTVGPCFGEGDEQARLDFVTVSERPDPNTAPQVLQGPKYEVKTVPGMRLFYRELDEPLADALPELRVKTARLAMVLVKSGASVGGPPLLIRPQGTEVLQLALPTRGIPQSRGQNKVRVADEFKCASMLFEGEADQLPVALAELAAALKASGLETSGEIRLAKTPVAGTRSVEIQLGLR